MSRKRTDCPYRNNILTDDMDCSVSSSFCGKGFNPGDIEQGYLLTDILCWLDEKEIEV